MSVFSIDNSLCRVALVLLICPAALGGCGGLNGAAVSATQPGMTAGLASTPAPAPDAAPIPTVQPGDSHLSCEAISEQMSAMDQIAAEKVDTGVTPVSIIPIIGDIATLADINAHAQRLQAQANRKNQAYQRKQYLVQLSGRLGC